MWNDSYILCPSTSIFEMFKFDVIAMMNMVSVPNKKKYDMQYSIC